MKRNTLENALKLLERENFVITGNVCRGLLPLAAPCSSCCLKEYEKEYCAELSRHKELYSILLQRVIRKQKLEKLLSQ